MTYTTQNEVRAAFWAAHPRAQRRYVNGKTRPVIAPQNEQPTDTRVAFCEFVDSLQRNGEITEALASRATL